MRTQRVAIALVVVAISLVPLFAASASAHAPTPIPQRYCHSVHAQGQTWGVDGTGPRCWFMRHWTVRWLNHRKHPSGWKCVDLGDGGQCDKRHSDAFFEYYVFD
jgi:hypothetical protein